MIKTYFTFGTDPLYPFSIYDYVVVYGEDIADCLRKFRKKHLNPRAGREHIINCAFYYTEEKWVEQCAQYYDSEPIEVIM